MTKRAIQKIKSLLGTGKVTGVGIRRYVRTLTLVMLLLLLASTSSYATNYDMYRVKLEPPYIHAFDTEDAGGDEIIFTYVLQQIRYDQVINTRIGVSGVHHLQRHQGASASDPLILDIRRGDQIRVAVALVDVDDDSKEREILDTVREAARIAESASSIVFPPATPVLGVVNTALFIGGIVWEFFDWLDDNDDLGEASYILDFPTTMPVYAPAYDLTIATPPDWNYGINAKVTVSPEDQVLAGRFNRDGQTDIAKISMSRMGANRSFGQAFIDVALAGPRGSSFEISPLWGAWDSLRNNTHFGVGDFNGDGLDDVVAFTGYQSGGVWVALSQGNRFTITKWANSYPFYMNPLMHVAVGKFNSDRFDDILIVENCTIKPCRDNMWLGFSNGVDRFSFHQAGTLQIDRHTQMLPGDFDGDSITDVVVFQNGEPGEVQVVIYDGNTFVTNVWDHWHMNPDINVLAYDFNNDRKTDIITFQNSEWGGKIYLGYSQGTPGSPWGRFDTYQISAWPEWVDQTGQKHPAMTPFTHVLAGDFDGLGMGDLVRFEPGTPGDVRVTLWPYLGQFTPHPWEWDQTWAQWWSSIDVPVLAGDFDGDGKDDIAKCTLYFGPEGGKIWVGYSAGYFDSREVGTWVMR